MKNTAKIILISVLALASCKKGEEKKYAGIRKADWFVGTWENDTDGGTLSESWEKVNDSTYRGASYFIKNADDTLHLETVELIERKGEVTYNPTVQGQNDNKPVAFKMTSATDKQLVFENPAHDYPQKITYTKITADSIVAKISGIQQGKPSFENYPMKKK